MLIKGASMTASSPLVPCKIEYFWPKQQAGQIIQKKKNQQKPKTKSPSKRLGHVRKNLLNFRIRGGRNKCQEQTLTYIIICSNALFFSRPIFFNIDI